MPITLGNIIINGYSESATSSTIISYSPGQNLTPGETAIVWIGFDNTGTSTPTVLSIDKPAAETNNWVKLASHDSSSSSSGGGVRGELWAITGSTTWFYALWNVTLSAAVLKKSLCARSFFGISSLTPRSTVGTGTSTSGVPSAATSGTTPVIGDLAVGGCSFESNAMPTGDTDTTGGSWSSIIGIATSGGGSAANLAIGYQYKILTGANHQTYNPTGSGDSGAAVVILPGPPPPTITQAAYRFYADDGSESNSTALAAQSTAASVNVGLGDANLQLRIRLQSTTAVNIDPSDTFQLQCEKNSSGAWNNVVDPVSGSVMVDSNPSHNGVLNISTGSTISQQAQSFKGNGYPLRKIRLRLACNTAPVNDSTGYLYAHTGTYGDWNTSKPTGSALATSTNTVPGTSISSTVAAWFDFNFDGTYTMTNGTPYFLAIGTTPTTNSLQPSCYVTSIHSGNSAQYTGVWAGSSYDMTFEVYSTPFNVTGYDSALLADQTATTNRLTAGTGSFAAGKVSEDGLVTNSAWTGNDYTELLYAITLKQADLAQGDVLRFRVLHNGATTQMTYSQTPTINVAKTTVTATQVGYRFYNDDADEDSCTPAAAQDTALTVNLSAGNVNKSLRVLIQNTSASNAPSTTDWQLYVEKNNSGTWVFAGASVGIAWSATYTGGGATVNVSRLTGGTGTFSNGSVAFNEMVSNLFLGAGNYTEVMWITSFVAASLNEGDTLKFRVYMDGSPAPMTYPIYPQVTVTKIAAVTRPPSKVRVTNPVVMRSFSQ